MLIQTLKGFRDFLPKDARKRQFVINTLKNVFESYGFEPLETPALEYAEILSGKYGAEGDKLMYTFEDNGKRKVSLRYDQTVPLARVVAQYSLISSPQGQKVLPLPFKRYQIQPVWRAENTQKGRFREFLQCDIDTVGTNDQTADAEILLVTAKALETLGFQNYKILLNDRKAFMDLPSLEEKEIPIFIRAIDKLKKIGREKVLSELAANGLELTRAKTLLQAIESQKPSQNIKEILETTQKLGIAGEKLEFLPTLARGLDYYTGLIFEVEIDGYEAGSVCGGGRYDNLIGIFAQRQIPAVGCAFGFDRIVEAMNEQNLFPDNLTTTKILVTVFAPEFLDQSIEIARQLRSKNIPTELYLEKEAKIDKQLKYADDKKIPYVIILGPEELKQQKLKLRDMRKREEKLVGINSLLNEIF